MRVTSHISKEGIEGIVNEIVDFLKSNNMDEGVNIYFNNKHIKADAPQEIEEGISPMSIFETAEKHVISMTFEGPLYHILNGDNPAAYTTAKRFEDLLDKYGLMYILVQSWNLYICPIIYDDIEFIEYTSYEAEGEPIHVGYYVDMSTPEEIIEIKDRWYALAERQSIILVYDGTHTVGAAINFDYKGKKYHMDAPEVNLGSLAWENVINTPLNDLRIAGATNVAYCPGMAD